MGDRIECNTGGWSKGTVVKTWYREDEWPNNKWAPYQVQLDSGNLIYAPIDRDPVCRAPGPEFFPGDRVEIVGLVSRPEHNGKEATIVRWSKPKERYLVNVGLKKPIAVRLGNLRKLTMIQKLCRVIRTGDQQKVETLVRENPELCFARDDNGYTPLAVSINTLQWSTACWFASLSDAGRFVNTHDPEGETPLHAAARDEQPELVDALLSAGADVNLKSIRSNEYTGGNYDMIDPVTGEKKVVSNEHRGPVFECAENGNAAIAQMLIDAGCRLDETDGDGCTALYVAMDEGNEEVCELLLKSGASPDIGNSDIGSDNTLLAWAASRRRLAQVRLLLKHGADPNKPGKSGLYPLHMAARCGAKAVLEVLIENGADPTRTCRTHRGCTGATALRVVEKNKQAVATGCLEVLLAAQ